MLLTFNDNPIPIYWRRPLPEQAVKLSSTTGEFAARRRLVLEVPVDAPPENVRLKLRAEVEYSLREVCGNWPTGEFDRVVADVTATAMKYHGRERRQRLRDAGASAASHIPGASAAVALVMSAVQSVQKFLEL